MASRIQDFDPITLPLPEKEIFFRLGGHAGKSGMSESFLAEYRQHCRQAFARCELKGRTRILDVERVLDSGVILSGGILLPGREFAAVLGNCDKIWCAAATAGKRLVEARDAQSTVAARSIYDAVGSECTEKAIQFLHEQSVHDLLRQREMLSPRRYSPGYGDMPLSIQQMFFRFLQLEEWGLTLTKENFIVPEKTVTAWAGITVMEKNQS